MLKAGFTPKQLPSSLGNLVSVRNHLSRLYLTRSIYPWKNWQLNLFGQSMTELRCSKNHPFGRLCERAALQILLTPDHKKALAKHSEPPLVN